MRHGINSDVSAFTLVELLVVVAVIALLVTMIVPSLSRAVALTRKVHCLSNLHQLGVAGHAYKSEHGCYPPEVPGIMGVAPPVEAWPSKFMQYAPSTDLFHCVSSPEWMKWDGRGFPQRGQTS